MAAVDLQPLLEPAEADNTNTAPTDKARINNFPSPSVNPYRIVSRASAFRKAIVVLIIATVLLSLSLVIRPVQNYVNRIKSGVCHRPLTVQERVHRILSQTPLIGVCSLLVKPSSSKICS